MRKTFKIYHIFLLIILGYFMAIEWFSLFVDLRISAILDKLPGSAISSFSFSSSVVIGETSISGAALLLWFVTFFISTAVFISVFMKKRLFVTSAITLHIANIILCIWVAIMSNTSAVIRYLGVKMPSSILLIAVLLIYLHYKEKPASKKLYIIESSISAIPAMFLFVSLAIALAS